MAHKIFYIDVFTTKFGFGNPVAVVFDADDLSQDDMQRIASWTNLSETTFIQKAEDPKAHYKMRIFTPRNELPFAGHPTIGSCYAAIANNFVTPISGKIIQECKVGLVEINIGDAIEFCLPNAQFTPLSNDEIVELSGIIGETIAHGAAIVNVGPKWIIGQLENGAAVLNAKPDFGAMKTFEKKLGATGVTIFGKFENGNDFIEVRSFAPSDNIDEDPVCGSGNGAVCAFMLENQIVPNEFEYTARQGRAIGRDGIINARILNGKIYIGGKCVIGVKGVLER